MSNQTKDQICHCPQFHKGKCTPETAKNYPKFPNLQKLVKKIAKQIKKKHDKTNKKK